MRRAHICVLLLLAQVGLAQSNVYSLRIIGHTPFYERILFSKGHVLRSPSLRGVDDLKSTERYTGTNRIDQIFADPSRERKYGFYSSCLSEVPLAILSLRCPGDLLDMQQVRALLRDAVAIPRSDWTNHAPSGGDLRYVFSLVGTQGEEYVVDERSGAFCIVYFPDGSYRCVVGLGYSFVKEPQKEGAANGNRSVRLETSGTPPPTGPRQ